MTSSVKLKQFAGIIIYHTTSEDMQALWFINRMLPLHGISVCAFVTDARSYDWSSLEMYVLHLHSEMHSAL